MPTLLLSKGNFKVSLAPGDVFHVNKESIGDWSVSDPSHEGWTIDNWPLFQSSEISEFHTHHFVPYPSRGKVAEVRMIYCEDCGETRIVEATNAVNKEGNNG